MRLLAAIGIVLLGMLLVIIAILIVGFPELYWMQYSLAAMPQDKRQRYYAKRTAFYHLLPTQEQSPLDQETRIPPERATELTHLVDAALRSNSTFSFVFRNVRVCSGLPRDVVPVVIWHISGAWTGLFPNLPGLNGWLSGHAMPIRDVISRHTFLNLGYPVVCCRMPTDAICALNFGGQDDQLVLNHVFDSICQKAQYVIASADCLGGLRFMRWWQHYQGTHRSKLAGAIIEGPLPTMDRICRPANSELVNQLISSLFSFALPNFDPNATKVVGLCPVPALISVLEEDGLCGKQDIPWIRATFPQLYSLLTVPKQSVSSAGRLITHGNAYRWPPFRSTLERFLDHVLVRVVGKPSTSGEHPSTTTDDQDRNYQEIDAGIA